MLKLENITVKFNNKSIFENTCFKAYNNQLTLIIGKSGVGKSTLIDTLLFKHNCVYKFNDTLVKDKELFLKNNISIVTQEPIFLNQLKVKDNIQFIIDTYKLKDRQNELLSLLDIKHTLNKYPMQLSGGEKMRLGLYLAVLKKPRILILDEPTAALDARNKDIIIDYLLKYAYDNHIVICATHDKSLIDKGDRIYNINNHVLNIVKEQKENTYINEKDNHEDFSINMFKMFKKINKYHIVRNYLLKILLSISIAFVFIALSLNNGYINQMQNSLNDFSTNNLIVYQSIFKDNEYSFSGSEYPMNEEVLNKIKAIDDVESVRFRYDISMSEDNYFYNNDDGSHTEYKNIFTLYDNKNMVNKIQFDESIQIHVYDENINYDKKIMHKYNKEGVYLSSSLFDKITNKKNISNPTLYFNLPIPIYNTSGISEMYNMKDNTKFSTCNNITCYKDEINLPIRGVTKDVLTDEDLTYPYHMYIPRKYLEEKIDEFRKDNSRTLYASYIDHSISVNKLPNDLTTNNYQIIKQTPYKANAYNVKVKKLSSMSKVISKIKKLGIKVENQYFNTDNILDVEVKTRNHLY